jgi:hypothetical protein
MHPDMETYLLITIKAATIAIGTVYMAKIGLHIWDLAQFGL